MLKTEQMEGTPRATPARLRIKLSLILSMIGSGLYYAQSYSLQELHTRIYNISLYICILGMFQPLQ